MKGGANREAEGTIPADISSIHEHGRECELIEDAERVKLTQKMTMRVNGMN